MKVNNSCGGKGCSVLIVLPNDSKPVNVRAGSDEGKHDTTQVQAHTFSNLHKKAA